MLLVMFGILILCNVEPWHTRDLIRKAKKNELRRKMKMRKKRGIGGK